MIRLSLCFVFILVSSVQSAELLNWQKDSLSYSAKLDDKGTLFTFMFKNVSGKELNIEKIKSSCSCMSIKTSFPSKITPGSDGTILAYYDFTGKVGLNRGNIEVICDGQRIALSVEVDIPVPVTITPRFLIWKKGERGVKDISVKLHSDWKGKVVDVKSSIEGLKTEMTKVDAGYTIKVIPPSVEQVKKKRTWLLLNGVDDKGAHKEYRIYLILN